MRRVLSRFGLLAVCAWAVTLPAQQLKELDSDVNYDESKIVPYNLPALLGSAEGNEIKTAEEWMHVRRPQILSLFANLVYGRVPVPADPIKTDFTIEAVDRNFMGGKAVRKRVSIRFRNRYGEARMTVLVFVPAQKKKPAPAFMVLNFIDNTSEFLEVDPSHPTMLKIGLPLGEILDRGYAFVSVYHQDLVANNEVDFQRGPYWGFFHPEAKESPPKEAIHRLFYKKGQSFPKESEWGVLAACGWGAMRALDYLATDDEVDHTRTLLMGHSKLGKAALWAAAQDQRFALVISVQSGAGGASLWRRRIGETLEKMSSRFPYWLCGNARKFVNREDDLPVDQHMLLALMAPRPVYVASAVEDRWADPRGEYLSAHHASEVYRLLGKKGLESEASPQPDQPIIESDVGYHIRRGGHSVKLYDWRRFLDFADHHLR